MPSYAPRHRLRGWHETPEANVAFDEAWGEERREARRWIQRGPNNGNICRFLWLALRMLKGVTADGLQCYVETYFAEVEAQLFRRGCVGFYVQLKWRMGLGGMKADGKHYIITGENSRPPL